MGQTIRCRMILGLVLCAASREQAQTVTTPSGQTIVLAGTPAAADTKKLTEKQKVLSNEADQLLAMATELKAEVDMTSKNILSLKVVRTAEQIEQYAHTLKDRSKK